MNDDEASQRPEDRLYEALVDTWVARHTVAFMHNAPAGATSGGSGVLAHFENIGGIVTCAHVLEGILSRAVRPREGETLGIVINGASTGQVQAIQLQYAEVKVLPMVILRGQGDAALGPDLGFLQLPESTMAALGALGSVLDLKAQAGLGGHPPSAEAREWTHLVAGIPAELVQRPALMFEEMVISLWTAIMTGKLHREPPHDGYDRIRLEPAGMRTYPTSYEGMSGSGIWMVGFGRDAIGNPTVVDRRLVGIAYYQTNPARVEDRQIIGHGPASLYERLLPAIVDLEREKTRQ